MTTSSSYRRDVVQAAHSVDCKAFSAHWAKNTEVSSPLLKCGVVYSAYKLSYLIPMAQKCAIF